MSKVRVEFLSWLTETLGTEGVGDHMILEHRIEGDKTVRHLLEGLAIRYPLFGQFVFDVKTQKLTSTVLILLNDRHLELINGLETKLSDGDVLAILTPMEGG